MGRRVANARPLLSLAAAVRCDDDFDPGSASLTGDTP
jgi:hypothetical protein